MSDRPIKFNHNGKYNLNFIDWQNQYQTIIQSQYNNQTPPTQSPIYGMSAIQFHSLMLQDSKKFTLDQDDLQKQLMGMGIKLVQVKKMRVGKTDKECTICIKGFIKGEVIRLLKCHHIFHQGCVIPWLQKRSCCPNCRAEQK